MTATLNGTLDTNLETPITYSVQVADRLFVFSDGTGLPRGTGPVFTVYDDAGTQIVAPREMTDATATQLAGHTYFGTYLPYLAQVRRVELGTDGSFALHFTGEDPSRLAENLGAMTSFSGTRYFTPDGTPLDAAPASMASGTIFVGGNNGSISLTAATASPMIDLGGTFASASVTGRTNSAVTFRLDTTDNVVFDSFAPSGEQWNSFVPVSPHAIALAQAGENVMLVYQDTGSRDVFVRLYDRNAQQVGEEFVLGGSNNVFYNRAVQDSVNALTLNDGTIVVTWSNQRDGVDADPELFYAHLSPTGTILRGPEVVNTDLTSGTQYDGQIFALADGGYAILYHTLGGSPYRQEAVVRQFDAAGNPVGPSVAFEDQTEGRSLNAHYGAIFPNGFGYMLDGLETEFTIQIGSGGGSTGGPVTPPTGTAGPDLMTGTAGNDRLDGLAGNDTINGGDGTDTIIGGDGDDFLFGGDSTSDLRDVMYGGDGNDSMDGGHGNDELSGGNGNDTVLGGFGSDTVIGNAGDDLLAGGAGSDMMFGGPGNDTLNGGFGYDRLNGGTGADRFFHLGVADHASDWIQDYNAAQGDVLVFGQASATRAQFQINVANTPNAGSADVAEAFVIYRPTGQIMWALVDGDAQTSINALIGGQVVDLLA